MKPIFALAVSLLAAGCAAPRVPVVQTLSGFHRPESVAFSLDGRRLFVGNCGSDLFGPERKVVGFVRGNGAVSRLAVGPDGRATVEKRKFIGGLNAPLGLAVLPVATKRYPKGTLLVNQGMALLCDRDGNPETDIAKLGTGILFFDPETGKRLGRIDLGAGSTVAGRIGHPVLLPNSLAFDSRGHLYVTDTAKGGDRLQPKAKAHPGLVRITHDAIDDPSKGSVTFTPVPGVPNGVGYWEARMSVCIVTMGGGGGEGEAVTVVDERRFPLEKLPPPYRQGVGTMDGIAFTPAGTVIVSRFSGDLLAIPPAGEPFPLPLDPPTPLVAPADHRGFVQPDGSTLIAVPEQARTEPEPWSQRVRFIRLPPGY